MSGIVFLDPEDIPYEHRFELKHQPFFSSVPKSVTANLNFRKKVVALGNSDEEHADSIRNMCAADPLFYINTFVWTYDPRVTPKKLPMVTYDFQNEGILKLLRAIRDGNDQLIEKSRDMGASWMLLIAFEYLWHFWPDQSFLLVSRKEDLVDKKGDPDSLFWKIDFIHGHMPTWMMPHVTRKNLSFVNHNNGSTIDGDSTTGDIARGGRRTAIGLDEFASVENGHEALASTGDATNCRIFNSTPKGMGNAFADLAHSGSIEKITFHWTQLPEKASGLYYDGNCKPRSTWYDRECNRRQHPMEIAQELDIDYLGSDYQFFDPIMINEVQRAEAREPMHRVEVIHDLDTGEFREFDEVVAGRMSLWHPIVKGVPVKVEDEFVVAADVATGTRSSNSVISVGRRISGEKVAEFVCNDTRPEALAKMALAICAGFKRASHSERGPMLIWEANGPGRNFGDVILESGYRNIWWKHDEHRLKKNITDIPGWWSTKDTKLSLLGDFRRAVKDRLVKIPSRGTYDEMKQYVFMPGGKIAHSKSANKIDPSAADDNHGDRVIADSIMWKAMGRSARMASAETMARIAPSDSMGARMDARQKARRARSVW